DLMGIRVPDPRGEAAAPQDDRHAVFGPGPHRRLDPAELDAVDGLRQFVRPFADPTGAAVRELHVLVDRREIASERDVPRLEVDADARGLERSAPRVDRVGVVSEGREVARADARRRRGWTLRGRPRAPA